jgi:hypothetical protein
MHYVLDRNNIQQRSTTFINSFETTIGYGQISLVEGASQGLVELWVTRGH